MSLYQRAGGLAVPIVTAVVAFFIGGLVVLATGHNPLLVYKGIISGTGLDFFIHFGHHHIDVPFTNRHIFFWWDTNSNAAFNLQQTLLTSSTLALTALSVAFAFRCGLFNIGGQGQYVVGAITGVWVGSSFVRMDSASHILLAVVLAMGAGALWGAIAGFLKATGAGSGSWTSKSRTSASSASPSRCSGATPPSGSGSRRSSSAVCSTGRRRAARVSGPTSFRRSSRAT